MNNPEQPGDEQGASRPQRFPYVLVADSDEERTIACVAAAAKTFSAGVLVARDGEDAISTLFRFGPPKLLTVDLSLPRTDGFRVIEALRQIDHGRTAVIAWAATRELREFANHRLAGLYVKVLGGAVTAAVLQNAIEWAHDSAPVVHPEIAPAAAEEADDFRSRMTALASQARGISSAAGVAVYLKPPEDSRYRAAVTWNSDLPMPPSPELLPRALQTVLETGDLCVLPDLADGSAAQRTEKHDTLRTLVAVPITAENGETVGAIVIFDVKPLVLGAGEMEKLKALGRPRSAERLAATALERAAPRRTTEMVAARAEIVPTVASAAVALPTRGAAGFAVARELARARREQLPLSVVLFDVMPPAPEDERAAIRDGDPFRGLGETLFRVTRASDLAIWWDTGQLLIVLSGLNEPGARQVAERVRAALQVGAAYRLAVAGGVAELAPGDTFDTVVARALEKVQLAKARGHNRIA